MLYIVFTDGTITMMETGLFLASYVVYIVILSQWSTRYPREEFSVAETVAEAEKHVRKK